MKNKLYGLTLLLLAFAILLASISNLMQSLSIREMKRRIDTIEQGHFIYSELNNNGTISRYEHTKWWNPAQESTNCAPKSTESQGEL